MGGCFSSRSSAKGLMNYVRVVHLNGCLEYFEPPVTVGQVTGNGDKLSSTYFVCTASQLLSTTTSSMSKLLRPGEALEPGHLYFLLPFSALQADVSPLNLAVLVGKLSAQAKRAQRVMMADPPRTSLSERLYVSSPMCSSPARSYASSPGRANSSSPSRSPVRPLKTETDLTVSGAQRSSGARSWRPNLDPIKEKSFNRRSESDLLEQHSEMCK
ncbi:hypothetical protein ACJRO7_014897 [Eucalyptus globulus]|uniref:Uncharacterized protein n=1 Tax=Eucalyptus globulus TaxID=34317 RepID=A0ABD3L1S6_EUCGL